MAFNPIFEPLTFRTLTIKNRIIRANMSGRIDQYDGSGTQARINFETKFARGGVGAIVSSFANVQLRGRIMPNYAMIDHDRHIPFWRAVGKAVHAFDCKYILQLSHGGRQRDIAGVEFATGLSSTDKAEPTHGFRSERMTVAQIKETVQAFADGASRARKVEGRGLREEHRGTQVRRGEFLPVGGRQRRDGGAPESGGVVHESVEPPESRHGRLDERGEGGGVGQVPLHDRRARGPHGVELADERFGFGAGSAVVHDDPGARGVQCADDGGAHALRAPRHQNCRLAHGAIFPRLNARRPSKAGRCERRPF